MSWTKSSSLKGCGLKAKDNTKAISERAEALEKKLQEAKTTLTGKDTELKSYVVVDDAKIQGAYY